MPQRSQRHRSTALPYSYCPDGLNFELESYSLDERKPQELNLDSGQTYIDLSPDNDTQPWNIASLCGQITIPDKVVTKVFPQGEREVPPAKLYITVQCHDTIYRDRVDISSSPTESGTYDVTIKLDRDDVRGDVVLHPYLVRVEEGIHDGSYASSQNVRVASGQSFIAIVDRSDNEESSRIDGEEVSFSKSDHLPDGDKLYHVDFRNEARPKLWINADHPRITDVLQTKGSVGAEPRMRDVILDQITYGVWTQLIVRAATAVDDEGEVKHEWQQTVLESFARDMYDTDSVNEAALSLQRETSDPNKLPHLMTRIDKELQKYINPRKQLINLMEEGLQI